MNNGAIIGLLLWAVMNIFLFLYGQHQVDKMNEDKLSVAFRGKYKFVPNWPFIGLLLILFTSAGQFIGSFF